MILVFRRKLSFEIKGDIIKNNLVKKQLTRLSNRQNTKMSFDGLIGTITINDIDINSFELLSLAELIGIGKQTSFGLGKVVVTKA